MASVKRCAVCPREVPSASIFCSKECQEVGRVLRNAQPHGDEVHTMATPLELSDDPLLEQLRAAGARYRDNVSVILAAYQHKQVELDALIWAAHTRGLTDRQIGAELEMRTSNVRRRVLAFQARMFGPVGGPVETPVAG